MAGLGPESFGANSAFAYLNKPTTSGDGEMKEWSQQATDRMIELWGAGVSASILADRLNAEFGTTLTRNAVLGRAFRVGLPGRPTTESRIVRVYKERPQPVRLRRKLEREIAAIKLPPTICDQAIPLEQRKSLEQLTEHTCRWPVGDVGEEGFFFCGAEPVKDRPYCAGHCAVAYAPVVKRVRRPERIAA